jgi:hypothetical protein
LKRQQINALLVQLVHAFLSLFGRWFKNRGSRTSNPAGFASAQQE